jgi:UDP-galactopyranose mutase
MLVCFSHLRWNFVWQRPQHLMARFARAMPVVFVEEPEIGGPAERLAIAIHDGVTVLTPHLPTGSRGFGPTVNAAIARLIAPAIVPPGDGRPPILWLYTPMALGAAPAACERGLVVYDAMDELANFRGAPKGLAAWEDALLARADLVFAGGPSLYEARRHRHPAVHCFPSGVEIEHFARAANGIARPADLNALPKPIVGFFGVIDERIGLGLLDAVAARRPNWTLAMIGPVAKIAAADLPRRPNLVWLGKRDYAALPNCLACFDVAMLPFARNAATRFISPTKTLEYLAGGKPVVSTPLADVVALYGDVVRVAATPEAFVAAIEEALAESAPARAARRERSRALLASMSWDRIAAEMLARIDAALAAAGNRATEAATCSTI